MSVNGSRISRIAVCCLLAFFTTAAAPAMADQADMETYYDSEIEPEGMLCTDDMIEEPYSDELEPTPAAHVEGCMVPELPIST
jgi:hypothetical protein